MAQPKKYLFEKDFDVEAAAEMAAAVAPPAPTFNDTDIENARTIGFAEGRTAGVAEAQGSIERLSAQTLGTIAARLVDFLRAHAVKAIEDKQAALELAVAIARKAVPAVAEAQAVACVETLVRDALPNFIGEPRIAVRVAERTVVSLKPRLEAQIAASGFAGKVVMTGDASLTPPDCKIEWTDGGVEIDTAGVWHRIDESLAAFVAASSAGAGQPDANTAKPKDQ